MRGPPWAAGTWEWQAIAQARQLLLSGAAAAEPQHQQLALGPSLGQCCGGTVELRFEPLSSATLAGWPVTPPLFHLQLYGAGHVGRAMARLLLPLSVQVDWVDEREDEFPAALLPGQPWPAHIRRVAVDAVQAEVALAPPGAFYLVLTHQHDLDLQLTQAILARGTPAILGLIGSATKRQRFVHRLEERGFSSERIARITCPIGVPGIPGKEPEVLALGVVAQLLQVAAARDAALVGVASQPAASACSAATSSTVTR